MIERIRYYIAGVLSAIILLSCLSKDCSIVPNVSFSLSNSQSLNFDLLASVECGHIEGFDSSIVDFGHMVLREVNHIGLMGGCYLIKS